MGATIRPRGFTLIEVLVVLAILSVLLSIVTPRYFSSVSKAEESVLKENLYLMRDALDKHFADTGRYPEALDDLVAKHYLRSVPRDPVTGQTHTWVIVAPPVKGSGLVFDVRSGAKGIGRDGTPYGQW